MNVKSQVLDLLQNKEWISCADFEAIFPPGTEGHLSWGQRMRELRSEGFRINKRKKEGRRHTWEYTLIRKKQFIEEKGQYCFTGVVG